MHLHLELCVFPYTQIRYSNTDDMLIPGVNVVKEKHRLQREGVGKRDRGSAKDKRGSERDSE